MKIDADLLVAHRLFHHRPRYFAEQLEAWTTPGELLAALSCPVTPALRLEAEQDLEWLAKPGHHLVHCRDADYPAALAAIHDPPVLLFADGDRSVLSITPALAIVGARAASVYGLSQAEKIATEVAAAGVCVVSGLALGIDAAAHRGALEGPGQTIAVLGSGCDDIYPRRNWRLAACIRETGLIISELPLQELAAPHHFPRRNRIVTGLCQATLVIEAALKSGSLISARLAANEGRDVLALPGQVTNRQARGTHQLIRDGATLVEDSSDVLRELGLAPDGLEHYPAQATLTEEQQHLMKSLSSGAKTLDMLATEASLAVEELAVNLVTLEVLGLVVSNGGRYQRVAVD